MKTILGIIGTIGSGKDTAAEYLSKKLSIPTFQISQPLKDIAKERNIEPTRENLIKLGSSLVQANGPAFLVEYLIKKVPDEFIIITGIRVVEIIDYLRKNYNLTLLAVTAEPEIRFQRCLSRNKLGEAKTLEDFLENEQRENSAPNVQRLFECMTMADCIITNDGNLEDFLKKVDEFLELKGLDK